MVKQLLYPEYLNKMNLSLVKIRHHKTECVIITKEVSDCNRFSIVKCDSDSDSDDSSTECHLTRQNAIIDSSSSTRSSSSNPFGYIRYYNPQNETETEIKYESFIDYGEQPCCSAATMIEDTASNKKNSISVTSSAKIELVHQNSESSDASSFITSKPYLACEDLVHIDENLPLGNKKIEKLYIPTIRQSLPTKFVGNKFSENSLTTIDIPQWQSNSDTNIFSHTSNLNLEVTNTLPLPDKIVAELLYSNLDTSPTTLTKSESMDSEKSCKTVIKPPLQNTTTTNPVSLSLEHVGFRKHSINSDKPKKHSIRRCVSSHFIRMGYDTATTSCCMTEMCHSPRSSDSGMAGSCTLNSPDFGVTDQDEERSSIDLSTNDLFLKREMFATTSSLTEMEARDFNSQCPCTSPFGSTPRTSCDTPSTMSHPLKTIDYDTSNKSKSLDCLKTAEITNNERTEIFKSGLYAHWWLKAKIPACVVKGIYEETRSPNTGKGLFLFCFVFHCGAAFVYNRSCLLHNNPCL